MSYINKESFKVYDEIEAKLNLIKKVFSYFKFKPFNQNNILKSIVNMKRIHFFEFAIKNLIEFLIIL